MKRALPLFVLLAGLCCPSYTQAQLAFGGQPYGVRASRLGMPDAPELRLPDVDVAALEAEDAARTAAGYKGVYRFGYMHSVQLDSQNHGVWHTMPNGDRVWRVALFCPGAKGIGVIFSDYVVPEGAHVFLYNHQGDRLGGFTAQSNPGHQVLGVQPVKGDHLTIEYVEPANVAGQGSLTIGTVTHVYRSPGMGFDRDLGDSGACNVNTICPSGDDWRPEIRSVALVLAGGGSCTGTLVNNCANDSIPYFLTANHCLEGGATPDTWVFRFNWDSPVCDPTENGPTDMTVSGSTQLVANPGSDMLFLQLNSQPPPEFDVTYSGWDATGAVPDSGTCIHHPRGDIKKISHDNNPQAQANAIDVGSGPADCWHVFNWDSGTTEPGSSGSALWNQDHRIIGQLYGGAATCDNNVDDYYGRFDVSYPFISEWLGDCDTLDLLDPGYTVPVIQNDAAITSISNVGTNICGDSAVAPNVTLKNNGAAFMQTVSISYWIIGGASNIVPWVGNLAPNQTVNVSLPAIAISTGPQTLVVGTLQPNGQLDGNSADNNDTLEFVANTPAEEVILSLSPDDYGQDITWELSNDLGTVLYQGGPYADGDTTTIEREFCLGEDCYVFTINDEFGDGICCTEGNGQYTIEGGFTAYVESDGDYGFGETQEFCIAGVGVPEPAGSIGFQLWPNPSNGNVNIRLSGANSGTIAWTLSDLAGRTVNFGTLNGTTVDQSIRLPGSAEGSYILRLRIGDQLVAKPLLLKR